MSSACSLSVSEQTSRAEQGGPECIDQAMTGDDSPAVTLADGWLQLPWQGSRAAASMLRAMQP